MRRDVSPRKRAANKHNAQRSTGPKSAQGKQQVSLNARQHGLSAPVCEAWVRTAYPELIESIAQEGVDEAQCVDLAIKIIEYERVEARLLQEFQRAQEALLGRSDGDADDPGDPGDAASQGHPQLQPPAHRLLPAWSSADEELCRRFLQQTDPQTLKQWAASTGEQYHHSRQIAHYRKVAVFLLKQEAKQRARQRAAKKATRRFGLERYFKRASNQLVKAIQRLPLPSHEPLPPQAGD